MTTKEIRLTDELAVEKTDLGATTGAASAAMVGAGIGSFVMGLMTTGAVISEGLKGFLGWYTPAGPLSGKTGVALIAWLISWILLHYLWRGKNIELNKAFRFTLFLIGLGVILTFPPVFEAFE